ncbi:MAG TPA: PAS domain S-box protein, partial [Adhaeribacter sp.]|nr:PAS domain S-box protein [Adhaeribacter sp.]
MEKIEYSSPTPFTYRRLRSISRLFSVLVIVIAVLVLIGWLADILVLKRLSPGSVAMNPVTALGLITAGSSLYLRQEKFQNRFRNAARLLAFIIIIIGGLKIIVLLTGIPFPFDQVLFSEDLWEPRYKIYNALAPNTAVNFVLTGIALLVINRETRSGQRPAQYIAIISSLLALVSLYGYVYRISALYTVTTFLPMAPHTALSFLFLSFGVLFARPDKGTMSIVIGESSSQIIFMRFLAMLLPLVFGWLKLQGEKAGFYSTEAGTAMFAVLTYVVAMYLLGRRSVLQHKIRETKRLAMDIIKENERQLQAILDNSATNISLKTVLGKYTLVNKQFEKDFNLKAEDVLTKTDYDLFPRGMARELNQYDHQIIKTGKPKSFEEKYPQADGVHTYLTVKFPLFTKENKIYALGAVSTDITKRKHLEEELRKSHQRLFSILDNIGEGVMVADPDGNIIIFNKTAEEILGTAETNASQNEWSEAFGLFKPDRETLYPVNELPLTLALTGKPSDNAEMFVKNDKFPEGRWISVTGRPVLDLEQEVIAGVVVFRDITVRKRLENLFKENEERLKLILASIGEGVIILNE